MPRPLIIAGTQTTGATSRAQTVEPVQTPFILGLIRLDKAAPTTVTYMSVTVVFVLTG